MMSFPISLTFMFPARRRSGIIIENFVGITILRGFLAFYKRWREVNNYKIKQTRVLQVFLNDRGMPELTVTDTICPLFFQDALAGEEQRRDRWKAAAR